MHWNHLNPLDSSGIQWTMTGLVVHWTGTGLRKVACSPPTWPSNWATGIHWTPLDSTGIHMDYVGDGKDLPRVCYMRYGGMPLAAKAEIMQSEYKNSRQVLSILSPEVLRFLDLEAQVSKVETDDQIGSDEGDLIDNDEDIDESNSGDAHRNLLREVMMPSDDDAFWESFLECVTAYQHNVEEDVQDIGKGGLYLPWI
ncbi:uncharacterized protein LACBIDRAFT_332557 [Laccaria bicolor S238N-H82]|uniref:Predicted protein n=1 Tax=Laccaria bicolor (strain S238N-H82 / ATCC MYA-4686) TaxID=486041 RepID=B0DT45_LACBS|nr:uncharacterized protein LACBIDRAFT_332557 [Laccaria bicolor S238N-H82]EDR02212.1 predicted protein [Laccaria bicolor S238N-H82]|eukprot:XP_001887157.1 predicted protein [Laccaria bicolor S238N-H82]